MTKINKIDDNLTATKTNIIDEKTVEVGSYPFSIQAIERGSLTESTNSTVISQRQNPINIKIKIQNTHDKFGRNGVLASRSGSKKLKSLNSGQTIMSFDLVGGNSLINSTKKYGSKFVKLLIPGKCITSKTKDEDYSYIPRNSEINSEKYRGNFSQDHETKHDPEERTNQSWLSEGSDLPPIIILGKCKPGGCLDPVISEDRFTYRPTKKTLTISKDLTKDARTSQDKKKTIPDTVGYTRSSNNNENGDQITMKQKKSLLKTNNISSDAIITYPIISLPREIKTRKKSNENLSEMKYNDDKMLKKYQNELTEVFFRPSKTDERSRETRVNLEHQNILRIGDKKEISIHSSASDDQNSISEQNIVLYSEDNIDKDDNESMHTLSTIRKISENYTESHIKNYEENENHSTKSLSKIYFRTHQDTTDELYNYDTIIFPNKDNNNTTKLFYEKSLESYHPDIRDTTRKIEPLGGISTNDDNSQHLENEPQKNYKLIISSKDCDDIRNNLQEIYSIDTVQSNISKDIVRSKKQSRDDLKKTEISIDSNDNNIIKSENGQTNLLRDKILSNALLTPYEILESAKLATGRKESISFIYNISSEKHIRDKFKKLENSVDRIENNIIESEDSVKDVSRFKETLKRFKVKDDRTKSLTLSNTIYMEESSVMSKMQNAVDEGDHNEEVIFKTVKNSLSIESKLNICVKLKDIVETAQIISLDSLPKYINIVQSENLSDNKLLNKGSVDASVYSKHMGSRVFDTANDNKSPITESTPDPNDMKCINSDMIFDKKDDEVIAAGVTTKGMDSIKLETEERHKSTDSKSALLQKSPDITTTTPLFTKKSTSDKEYFPDENQQNEIKNENAFDVNDNNNNYLLKSMFSQKLPDITTTSPLLIKISTSDKEYFSDENQQNEIKNENSCEGNDNNSKVLKLNNIGISTHEQNIFNESATDLDEKNDEPSHSKRPIGISAVSPQTHHTLEDLSKTSIDNHKEERDKKEKRERGSEYLVQKKITKKRGRSFNRKSNILDYEEGLLSTIKEIVQRKSLSKENVSLVTTLLYDIFKKIPNHDPLVTSSIINKHDTIRQDPNIDITSKVFEQTKAPALFTGNNNESPQVSFQETADTFLNISKDIKDVRLSTDEFVSSMGNENIVKNRSLEIFNSVKTYELPGKIENNSNILLNLALESYVNNNNEKINTSLNPFLKSLNNENCLVSFIRKTARIDDKFTIPIDSEVYINIEVNSAKKQKIKRDNDIRKSSFAKELNQNDIRDLINSLYDHNLVQVENIIQQLTKDIQLINSFHFQRKMKKKSSIKSLEHNSRSSKNCKCYKRKIIKIKKTNQTSQ